jgi:hypothetical protein
MVEHPGVTSILYWVLEKKIEGRKKWIYENKDRVDFYVGYNLFMDKERT